MSVQSWWPRDVVSGASILAPHLFKELSQLENRIVSCSTREEIPKHTVEEKDDDQANNEQLFCAAIPLTPKPAGHFGRFHITAILLNSGSLYHLSGTRLSDIQKP